MKLLWQFSFWWFFTQSSKTFWSSSWSWLKMNYRWINYDFYIKQLTKLNNVYWKKRPKLANWNDNLFHYHWLFGKNYLSSVGIFCHIHHTLLTSILLLLFVSIFLKLIEWKTFGLWWWQIVPRLFFLIKTFLKKIMNLRWWFYLKMTKSQNILYITK